jgi:ABC-type transport system involved in multi-copper enzyme maturation permease subunit
MNALAFWAIIEESWRESWARRTSIALALIVLGLLLFFAFGVGVREVEGQPGMITISLFGVKLRVETLAGEQSFVIPKADFVQALEMLAVGLLIPWGILFGLFITTGLFSSMLVRGRLYLLLSKPIARWELYLARYTGGVLLVFVTTLLFCVGLSLLLWLKTGIVDVGLIAAGLVVVFIFAVLYSFATLLALLTEGTGVALVATLVMWGLAGLGAWRDSLRALSPTLGSIADVLYYILPKVNDLEAIIMRLIGAGESSISNVLFSLGTSALFAGAMLALGIYIFSRRDY